MALFECWYKYFYHFSCCFPCFKGVPFKNAQSVKCLSQKFHYKSSLYTHRTNLTPPRLLMHWDYRNTLYKGLSAFPQQHPLQQRPCTLGRIWGALTALAHLTHGKHLHSNWSRETRRQNRAMALKFLKSIVFLLSLFQSAAFLWSPR